MNYAQRLAVETPVREGETGPRPNTLRIIVNCT
jgi:hypothetical protein